MQVPWWMNIYGTWKLCEKSLSGGTKCFYLYENIKGVIGILSFLWFVPKSDIIRIKSLPGILFAFDPSAGE